MIIGYILLGFIIYFLYKFVVGFVLPIVRTTSAMKKKMREMHQPSQQPGTSASAGAQQQRMHADMPHHNDGFAGFSKQGTASKPTKSDYIDFEEIKE